MSSYAKNLAAATNRKNVDQLSVIPGREADMTKNSTGVGVSFKLNEWDYLDRFLILGTESSTYYATSEKITKDSVSNVMKLIEKDGIRVVDRTVEVSDKGLASKNDPALLVMALCSAASDEAVRRHALANLQKVARIGTHLFHYAEFVNGLRGWGRALVRAVQNWYNEKDIDALGYQMIKYQQRDGWSNRDLLRLSHPKTTDVARNALYSWATKGFDPARKAELPAIVQAFEDAKSATKKKEIINLIENANLPREAIPTQWLNEADVWSALLQKMPLTAMLRNLGKMSSLGMITTFSDAEKLIKNKLGDSAALRNSRVHPLAVLTALMTYSAGRGVRGSLTWNPSRAVVDALDAAFYLSFGNVKPTGKNTLLALDVSGSMTWGDIGGVPGLNPRVASAAMALVTANVESNYEFVGFTSGGWTYGGKRSSGWSSGISTLAISPKMRLTDVFGVINQTRMGGTDCALPMLWAQENKIPVDSFAIYTDNETYAPNVQPSLALKNYRKDSGRAAKLAVVGMTSTGFTIADPQDTGMMDFVGFSSDAPAVMNEFFSK